MECKNCGRELIRSCGDIIHSENYGGRLQMVAPYCKNPEVITNPITADLQPNEERLYTAIAIAQKKMEGGKNRT